MSGLYLAIATLAFGSIVGTVLQKWDSVTGGFDGFAVPTPSIFGIADRYRDRRLLRVARGAGVRAVAVARTCCARRSAAPWWRSATAKSRRRAWASISRAIRPSRSPSAPFITGLAGALFAHYVRFLAPDSFDILLSVQFVTIVFVGGLGSLHGAIFGALFVRLLPQAIAIVRDDLPFGIGRMPGLEPSLFGLVLVLCILFLARRHLRLWLKINTGSRPIRSSAAPASGGRNPMRGRSGCDEPVPR